MLFRSKASPTFGHPSHERIYPSDSSVACVCPAAIRTKPFACLLGKLQPQARAGGSMLGAMMMEQAAANSNDVLKPESFYRDAHRRIYVMIVDLFHASEPIDILTVTEALRNRDSAGRRRTGCRSVDRSRGYPPTSRPTPASLRRSTSRRVDPRLEHHHAEGIRGDHGRIDYSTRRNRSCSSGWQYPRSHESMSSIMRQALEDIDNARNQDGGVSGVRRVSWTSIAYGRLPKVRHDRLAARPGMGKTALVLTMARTSPSSTMCPSPYSL